MAIERFHDDENAYERWLRTNVGGYVFNHFGGPDAASNVVHRASCPFLARQQDEGRRTRIPKIYSTDHHELISVVRKLRSDTCGWKYCGACQPDEKSGLVGSDANAIKDQSAARPIQTWQLEARAPSVGLGSAPRIQARDFALWRPADVLVVVETEPLLASWEAKTHPQKVRVEAYLDELQESLDPPLRHHGSELFLHVDVVKQQGADLLHHNDVENFLTPIAGRLQNSAIVLYSGEKCHPRYPGDRSRITLGYAELGKIEEGFEFFCILVSGSIQSWKAAIRQALIQAEVAPAAAGPLDMIIAIRRPVSQRGGWWNSWKLIGDALGPILGEPRPTNPYDPADDRIVRLAIHHVRVHDRQGEAVVGIWWRPAGNRP